MNKDEQKNKPKEKQPASDAPGGQQENKDLSQPMNDPAQRDLGDLDRNLNEQFGGTGSTVTIEPNKF